MPNILLLMSSHPTPNKSGPKFLNRDYRYLLLTVILAVSLFLLFDNPNRYDTTTPSVPPTQTDYTPVQAPTSQHLISPATDSQKSVVADNSANSDFTILPVASNPETGSSKSVAKPKTTQNSKPVEKQTTVASNEPVAGPVTGQNNKPIARPVAKQNNKPIEKPVTLQNNKPIARPVTVQNNKPVQKPVIVQNNKPVQRPVAKQNNTPIKEPVTLQNNNPTEKSATVPLHKPSARDIDKQWQHYLVRKGDSLSRIFKRLQLPQALALSLSRNRPGSLLQRLRPGRSLYWKSAADHSLLAMSYEFSAENTLEIRQTAAGYQTSISPKPVQTVQRQARGKIISSLAQAIRLQRVPVSVMLQLVDIFGWDIDFGQDLRRGDRFNVLWQQDRWQGKLVRNGPVLAAEFVNQGIRYRAVRFTDSLNKTGYYAPDGSSLRRSFLKTPVKFSRISSGFSLRRYHPKLKKWRAHNGVDYAAPRGTSVRSTADGTILFKGWKGGYGRTVIIRHGGPYSTVYAHLSKFSRGLRSGSRVKQGDIIAYVGSSGLATGPHLHYEFRVNGKYKNPVTFRPPRVLAISKQELLAFRNSTRQYLAKLEAGQQIRIVANR